MIQSVDRALCLLVEVQEHPGLSLTELSEKVGLLPSTAGRLLGTLEKHGLVEREPGSKLYCLGPRAYELGAARDGDIDLARRLEPKVRELAAAAREQTSLAVLEGRQMVHVLVVDGAAEAGEQVILSTQAARRDSNLNATALGKVFLAFGPKERTESIIAGLEMSKTASRTIVEAASLRRHLDRVRRSGYAFSIDENTDYVRGVAAPVHRDDGALACALAVHGPAMRLSRTRLRELARPVKEVASQCSTMLGFAPQHQLRHRGT